MLSWISLFLERFRQSDFIRNAMVMITGTGIAQLIPILIIPILTRLYTPEEIGLLATFIAFFAIISIIAGGRYEYAIILPESDREGSRLLHMAALLSLVTGLLFFVVVLIAGGWIARSFGVPALEPWLWLLPAAITAQGLFMTFSFGLNRNKRYRDIASGKVTQTGSTAVIQVLWGIAGGGLAALVVGKVAGIVISAAWMVYALYRYAPKFFIRETFRDMVKTAGEYHKFPKYNAPLAFINNISNNLPVILFITFFSEAIAGFYAMAIRACYAPIQIISMALGQVVAKRMAEIYNEKKNVRKYVLKILFNLAAVGLVPFGLLFIAGPSVFGFILGSEWSVTGEYIRIITPYVYLLFVSQPLSYIPLIYGQQKKALIIYLFSFLLRMSGIFVGIWLDQFMVSLILYSATGVVVMIYHIMWYLKICETEPVDRNIPPDEEDIT